MKLETQIRKIIREMGDDLRNTDSDPEHIARFPHRGGCSRAKPLIRRVTGYGIFAPSPTDNVEVTLICPECKEEQRL